MLPHMAILRGGGGGGPSVGISVDGSTYTAESTYPDPATVTLYFDDDGSILATNPLAVGTGTWITGAFDPADYDLYVTPTAGTFSTGTINSNQSLSTFRQYTVTRTSLGSKSCTATYQIRATGTSTVLASGEITLTATVSS